MTQWKETRRAALDVEQAALLPALPRKRRMGNAALRWALRAAEAMEEKQLSNPVSASIPLAEAAPTMPGTAPRRGASRAALNHVLRR